MQDCYAAQRPPHSDARTATAALRDATPGDDARACRSVTGPSETRGAFRLASFAQLANQNSIQAVTVALLSAGSIVT